MPDAFSKKSSHVKRLTSFIRSPGIEPLWRFNQLGTSTQARAWLIIGVFLFALARYLAPVVVRGELGSPPSNAEVDGWWYDCEALQISQGNGRVRDFADPKFRVPYDQSTKETGTVYSLPETHASTVTTRKAPLFTYLLAGTYKIFGRQFVAIRILNALAMAGACAIVFWLLLRRVGLMPALLFVAMFVVINTESRRFASAVLTESLACLFVACLALFLVRLAETGQVRWVLLAGVTSGLSVLHRNAFVLWLPGLALTVLWILSTSGVANGRASKWRLLCYYVLVTSVLILPWFIQNCIVLQSFMPTGTQGFYGLASVYSDRGLEHQGEWKSLPKDYFDGVDFPKNMTATEKEKQVSLYCRSRVLKWIRNNPEKLPGFTLTKISRFWLKVRMDFLAVLLALIGLIIFRGYPEGKVFLALLLICTFQIALTYLDRGRFQVPILSLIFGSASVGVWSLLQLATSRGKEFRLSLFLHNEIPISMEQKRGHSTFPLP